MQHEVNQTQFACIDKNLDEPKWSNFCTETSISRQNSAVIINRGRLFSAGIRFRDEMKKFFRRRIFLPRIIFNIFCSAQAQVRWLGGQSDGRSDQLWKYPCSNLSGNQKFFLQEEASRNILFCLLRIILIPDPWHLTVSRRDVDVRIQTWIHGSYPTKPTIMPPFAQQEWSKNELNFLSLLQLICFVFNLQVFLTSRNSGDAMIDFSVFRLI